MLIIDGSMGEGGGQTLRTSLALSCLLNQPVEIINIRSGRSEPGLRPQHSAAITAATTICDGECEGNEIGSTRVVFKPGEVSPGTYRFDVGTAGSVLLVLHTVYLPLALSGDSSRLKIEGGTHVPWSPPFEHADRVWSPVLKQMGLDVNLSLLAAGYYPRGGGRIDVKIEPVEKTKSLNIVERGELKSIKAIGAVSNLEDHIADRLTKAVKHKAAEKGVGGKLFKNEIIRPPSTTQGAYVFVQTEFDNARAGFVGWGTKGKRAEIVASEVWNEAVEYLNSTAPIESHLADQILLPLSVADGTSEFLTSKITSHLLTNARLIEQFGVAKIKIEGEEKKQGKVFIEPCKR